MKIIFFYVASVVKSLLIVLGTSARFPLKRRAACQDSEEKPFSAFLRIVPCCGLPLSRLMYFAPCQQSTLPKGFWLRCPLNWLALTIPTRIPVADKKAEKGVCWMTESIVDFLPVLPLVRSVRSGFLTSRRCGRCCPGRPVHLESANDKIRIEL
jgi:hypothetical protein